MLLRSWDPFLRHSLLTKYNKNYSEPDCVNSLILSESVNKWAAKWKAQLQEILNVRPKFGNEGRDLHLQYQSYKTCLARPISATMRSRK